MGRDSLTRISGSPGRTRNNNPSVNGRETMRRKIRALHLSGTGGMSVSMSQKKVLRFPKPPQEPEPSTLVVQIGQDRFAIHWEIEGLPPVAPLIPWERRDKKVAMKIVK